MYDYIFNNWNNSVAECVLFENQRVSYQNYPQMDQESDSGEYSSGKESERKKHI